MTARRDRILLFSVLVVATCGLVYELISATMASYLLGDSVTQFSLVIGAYLSAMGLGSYLSRFIDRNIAQRFVQVQLIIAVVGGTAAPALFFAFAQLHAVRPVLYGILLIVGSMVGLEIPLLMRLLKDDHSLKDLVARVLAFDYLGALAASILFPLALLPYFGLVRTSLMFGVLNALVALWTAYAFRDQLRTFNWLRAQCLLIAGALGAGAAWGREIERAGENSLFDAPVVFSKKTPYQRLTLTRWRDDIRLFIDGNLQFSSMDEYRYHEALVHPAMAASSRHAQVLMLGGGDGLGAREVLRYPEVERIDLVDLDPEMTRIFRDQPPLVELNEGSLSDPRVHVHNADAMTWLDARAGTGAEPYDVIIVDLPDPNNFSLGKLYTVSFYQLVRTQLAAGGALVVQSTSPYLAPRAFACIVSSIRAAGLTTHPYHAHVPSFGDWGFILAGPAAPPERLATPSPLRFLNDATLASLFVFPADQALADIRPNRLGDQLLVHYYEQDLAAQAGAHARR